MKERINHWKYHVEIFLQCSMRRFKYTPEQLDFFRVGEKYYQTLPVLSKSI